MKTYKALREDWFKSSKSTWNKKEVKIYKNPTFKELAEAQYDGRGGFRAFIMPNGNMFAWGTEFHQIIRKNLKEYNNKTIPITGTFKGRGSVDITLSNDILYSNSVYSFFDIEDIAELVRSNRHLKKLFSKIDVDEREFQG